MASIELPGESPATRTLAISCLSFRVADHTTGTGNYAVVMSNPSRHMLWVRNSDRASLKLCVEPWANEILMEPDKAYLVVFDGPEGKFPEVE